MNKEITSLITIALMLWGTLVLEWTRNEEAIVTHYTMWKISVDMDTLRTEEKDGRTLYFIDTFGSAIKVGDDVPQTSVQTDKVEGSIPDVYRSDLANYAWFVKAHDAVGRESGPSNVVHCGKNQWCVDRYLKPGAATGVGLDKDER